MTASEEPKPIQIDPSQNDLEYHAIEKSLASRISIPKANEEDVAISKPSFRRARLINCCFAVGILTAAIVVLASLLKSHNKNNAQHSTSSSISAIQADNTQLDSSLSLSPSPSPSSPAKSATVYKPGRRAAQPTPSPTVEPTTFAPTALETTLYPTSGPTYFPTNSPTDQTQVATFIGLGDIPYDSSQEDILRNQIQNIDYYDADFVIHVGDIRRAGAYCKLREYETVANILRLSSKPVFILPGDNDWNDCPNMDEGWQYWSETFMQFESRHWDHNFQIDRLPNRPETFSFVHKGTLFIGLNIVGDKPRNGDERNEWYNRLTDQVEWTRSLILDYSSNRPRNRDTGRVVIFGHADPTEYHAPFFDPLSTFIQNELKNNIPILYVNGDTHEWSYDSDFYGQSSLLRITLSGEGKEPPTLFNVEADGQWQNPQYAFDYDRRLG